MKKNKKYSCVVATASENGRPEGEVGAELTVYQVWEPTPEEALRKGQEMHSRGYDNGADDWMVIPGHFPVVLPKGLKPMLGTVIHADEKPAA